ncbi:MAG: hypothetical protein Kow0073_11470 [Immundisolibacter sp.]
MVARCRPLELRVHEGLELQAIGTGPVPRYYSVPGSVIADERVQPSSRISGFIMLVAYYRSCAIPLVALAALPLAFIGVFPGHLILGAEFSVVSMVGLIALVGMVARASLLIIELGRDAQAQGMTLRDAMRTACALRLRPIVLTALTNRLGATVMLLDPVFRGLAISVIFGHPVLDRVDDDRGAGRCATPTGSGCGVRQPEGGSGR